MFDWVGRPINDRDGDRSCVVMPTTSLRIAVVTTMKTGAKRVRWVQRAEERLAELARKEAMHVGLNERMTTDGQTRDGQTTEET